MKDMNDLHAYVQSLPPRERGLKLKDVLRSFRRRPSLPPRERGLKLNHVGKTEATVSVAPTTGAWIETHTMLTLIQI